MSFFILVVLVVCLDQFTKYLVLVNMSPNETYPVIPSFFHITHVNNPGAAFGLLADKTVLFIVVTIAVLFFVFLAYRLLSPGRLVMRLALALILGGALGNLIDRVRFGYVVDFLDFRIWPVFNLADAAIVCGVALLIYQIMLPAGQEKNL